MVGVDPLTPWLAVFLLGRIWILHSSCPLLGVVLWLESVFLLVLLNYEEFNRLVKGV
jgi:hypothetical protein